MESVSVIGLGKLGACMAAAMAGKNHVIGVDISERNVACINQGIAPVIEPQLSDYIQANRVRLKATTDIKKAILETGKTFIIVPTPSDEKGAFSLRFVKETIQEIGLALQAKKDYHLVVVTSTILPGAMESEIRPLLEEMSGKKCGQDFGLCYNPEFIALGSVIHDLLHPDFILIGESDQKAGAELEAWYQRLCDNNPPVARMNFINAEISKISVNTYVTTKITFANMLAGLCEHLPGADIDVVTAALGMDSRIGRRYLTGALGYGGPCFPRDNKALAYTAQKAGTSAPLADITDKTNRELLVYQSQKIQKYLQPDMTVAILGLAYKPDTNVIEESQGIALAETLAGKGIHVVAYDPVANENAQKKLGAKARFAATLSDALKEADAVVIVNPSGEFKALTVNDFPRRKQPVLVFDCWRILKEKLQNSETITYIPLGVGTRKKSYISVIPSKVKDLALEANSPLRSE